MVLNCLPCLCLVASLRKYLCREAVGSLLSVVAILPSEFLNERLIVFNTE